MQGINPSAPYLPTDKKRMDATTYTVQGIDANFNALIREGTKFQLQPWPLGSLGGGLLPTLRRSALCLPGHYYNGSALVEVGAWALGDFTLGSPTVLNVGNTTGMSVGQAVLGYALGSVNQSGDFASGSNVISNISDSTNMFVGMPLYGPCCPPGAIVGGVVQGLGGNATMIDSVTLAAVGAISSTGTGQPFSAIGQMPATTLGTVIQSIVGSTVTLSLPALLTGTQANMMAGLALGAQMTGDLNGSGLVSGLPSTAGLFVGFSVFAGTGHFSNSVITSIVSPTSVQVNNTSGMASGLAMSFLVPAPASNSRIDYVYIDPATAVLGWFKGTESLSPVTPSLPAGKLPLALLFNDIAHPGIFSTNISDVRDLTGMGLSAGAYSGILVPTPLQVLGITLGLGL